MKKTDWERWKKKWKPSQQVRACLKIMEDHGYDDEDYSDEERDEIFDVTLAAYLQGYREAY